MIGVDNLSVETGILTGEYDYTKKKASNDRTFSINSQYDSSDPMNNIIGLTSVAISSMHSYMVSAEISEDSTDEDPVVKVRCPDENGEYHDSMVHVNDVDPSSATDMEMFAYLSWNDHIGNKVPGTLNSYCAYTGFQTMSGKDYIDSPKQFMEVIHNAYDYVNKPLGFLKEINNIDARRLVLEGKYLLDIFDKESD